MSTILITGSSRGIGLELVKQLLKHQSPPAVLIATCRKPEEAEELQKLSKAHKNLHLLKLDVLDFNGLDAVANSVQEIVGDRGLSVLINNAGIAKTRDEVFDNINSTDFIDTFLVNSVAPLMITKALRPLLKKAADANKSNPIGWTRATVINISSFLGSIESNTFGGWWAYRESKASLNMSTRSLAVELGKDGILAMAMHPGWVKTDMGTNAADLRVEDSVSGMLRVFYSLGPSHQGSFYKWDGQVLPW